LLFCLSLGCDRERDIYCVVVDVSTTLIKNTVNLILILCGSMGRKVEEVSPLFDLIKGLFYYF
jgi:hypothetical protein